MSVFNIFDKAKWARKCEPRPVWAFIFPHDKDCGHLSATHIFFIRQLNTAFGTLYIAHGKGAYIWENTSVKTYKCVKFNK